MIEKQEADDFDDTDEDALEAGDDEEVDLARLARDMDMDMARRRGSPRAGVPAWRRLELLAEQRRTAELTSDFDDYDLDEPKRPARGSLRLGA